MSIEQKHLGTPCQSVTIVEEADAETKEVSITVLLPYYSWLNNSYFNQSTYQSIIVWF